MAKSIIAKAFRCHSTQKLLLKIPLAYHDNSGLHLGSINKRKEKKNKVVNNREH